MEVNLSNWLVSTVRLYPSNVKVAEVEVFGRSGSLNVTLMYVDRSSPDVIKTAWKFATFTDTHTSDTVIVTLYRLTGEVLEDNLYMVLATDYTWGQIYLLDIIKLIGAV